MPLRLTITTLVMAIQCNSPAFGPQDSTAPNTNRPPPWDRLILSDGLEADGRGTEIGGAMDARRPQHSNKPPPHTNAPPDNGRWFGHSQAGRSLLYAPPL